MKTKKQKGKRRAPSRAPGPVTNRRKANKPLDPTKGRSFFDSRAIYMQGDGPGERDEGGEDAN